MPTKRVEDYYDKIKERFPELEDSEIKRILNHGFRSFFTFNTYGADFRIKDSKFTMYFGKFFKKKDKMMDYAKRKWHLKCKICWFRYKKIWDGYYYFGMHEEEYQKYFNGKKPGRANKKMTFEKLYLFKDLSEISSKIMNFKYIFRLTPDFPEEAFLIVKENYTTRNYTLIGARDNSGTLKMFD